MIPLPPLPCFPRDRKGNRWSGGLDAARRGADRWKLPEQEERRRFAPPRPTGPRTSAIVDSTRTSPGAAREHLCLIATATSHRRRNPARPQLRRPAYPHLLSAIETLARLTDGPTTVAADRPTHRRGRQLDVIEPVREYYVSGGGGELGRRRRRRRRQSVSERHGHACWKRSQIAR